MCSGVFIVKFEHISYLHGVKYGKTGFMLEKRKKSNKFNRLQIEVLSLPNIPPPSSPKYRPLKFVLCPYIHPRCVNRILRYNHQNNLKSLHPLHIINSKFPVLRENQQKHFCWPCLSGFSHWGGGGFDPHEKINQCLTNIKRCSTDIFKIRFIKYWLYRLNIG